MKKNIGLMILLLAGIMCMGCKHNLFETGETGKNGSVTIAIGENARTIVPVDWSLSEISKWTITFDPETEGIDNIVKTIEKGETAGCASSATYTLPEGTYSVTVEGEGTHYELDSDGSQLCDENSNPVTTSYTLTGASSVTVSSADTASVTIYVSLKKTDTGAGNGFEYVITFTDSDFYEQFIADNDSYSFNAYLTPVKSAGDKITLNAGLPSSGDNSVSYTFTDTVQLTDQEKITISSGYYYLTVAYTYDKKDFIVPLNDSLVEIADGLKTTGSYTDDAFAGVVTKTFYVDNSSEYNGLIPAYPKEFNSAIQWLDDNQGEWTNANLYFETGDASSATSYEEYVKALLPYYTNECNPTAGEDADDEGNAIYHEGYNKEVNVYIDGALNYVLKGGYVYITEDCVSNPSICFAGSSEHEDNEEDHSYAEGYVVYDDGVEVKELTLYQIATMVILNGVKDTTPCIKSIISPEMAKDYDPEDPDAYLKLETTSLADNESYANDNISLAVLNENGPGTSEGSYTVLTKEESPYLNCYTASAGQAGLNLSKAIPDFEISGESTVYIEDASSSYTVVLEDTTTELGSDYTYEWFLNGNSAGTESTYSLNPTTDSYIKEGSNTLMVVVGKDTDDDDKADEYASTSISITVRVTPIVGAIYSGKSLYSVDLTQDAYTGSVSSLTNVATSFTDFATDNSNYLYEAEVSGSTAYIYRYEDVTSNSNTKIYSRAIEDGDTDLKLYYDSDNDNLYAAYMNTTDNKIYIEEYADLSKITFDGTFNPTEYLISDTELLTFDDFAVYDDGNGSVKLYIISTLSSDTYPKIYYSANLNTSPNSGTAIDLYSEAPTDEHQIAAISITDITVNDGKVYALLRELSSTYSYGNVYSRGAVAEIDISLNEVTLYGYCSDYKALDVAHTETYTTSTFGFFGPSKFVAIKPEKLYVADDGAYYYTNTDVGNVNRIVIFDLENETITSSVDVNATFDYTAAFHDYGSYSGCSFDEIEFAAN